MYVRGHDDVPSPGAGHAGGDIRLLAVAMLRQGFLDVHLGADTPPQNHTEGVSGAIPLHGKAVVWKNRVFSGH